MIQNLLSWLQSQGLSDPLAPILTTAAAVLVVAILAVIVNFIARNIILRVLSALIQRSSVTWDDEFVSNKVLARLSHLAPAFVIHLLAPTALQLYPSLVSAVRTMVLVYLVIVGLSVFSGTMNAFLAIYERFPISRRVPLKIFVQVLKVVIFCLGGVFILASLIGKSPLVFFSGLGAFTAVLILVFKDTILGFVAGIQIMANNLVQRGDWIEMPKYGVDGDVIDVSLTTVKVQNWDKTIAAVPTYSLISDSFRNWRGMSESGGRRIKRSIALDMTSVKLCDEEMIDRFKGFAHIKGYIEERVAEVDKWNKEHNVDMKVLVNGRRLTNLGTFRAYVLAYLRNHPQIHQDMTLLVRHLAPSAQGLPIEFYVFSKDQAWANYESIQADIVDHLLAVIPLFDLRVFQTPSGSDLSHLAEGFAGARQP
ncbi:MAG: mechanosensitive ion channel family protein [Candidatus Eisenbacteria bacterium]|uniref:Mechanosensing system component YbdG n=1 Tax=Eiseniibacteriota bacterium TaxID=2212470 RepID=A0A7Y2ECW5_UNCEI|nr:mechanosensitive ion channel family protein [Candidatus Eisenbacteria bacterium]